jgi:hypothetical protein
MMNDCNMFFCLIMNPEFSFDASVFFFDKLINVALIDCLILMILVSHFETGFFCLLSEILHRNDDLNIKSRVIG